MIEVGLFCITFKAVVVVVVGVSWREVEGELGYFTLSLSLSLSLSLYHTHTHTHKHIHIHTLIYTDTQKHPHSNICILLLKVWRNFS